MAAALGGVILLHEQLARRAPVILVWTQLALPTLSWNEGRSTGGVSGAKRGRVPARFRSFPWCFQSHAFVAVTGKKLP